MLGAVMISLGYKERPDVVEKIDRIIRGRRRENPDATYSRGKFLREAVNRALADFEESLPKVRPRTRLRETVPPVKPVASA
ncbi:hypothetical protein GGQ91_005075 [Methylobacterium fujisawaense]|uniref:Uncharacterized protein n=1 Tax=Methylobacterium fujisawaense TaxID=107400 RepID=A0ABR6DHR6_9HYPH|nr:hypothetical protein [Methylobacterium fujisawaense]MBA9065653.1 hypothetical protein [Methylobacterium fujisawaense]